MWTWIVTFIDFSWTCFARALLFTCGAEFKVKRSKWFWNLFAGKARFGLYFSENNAIQWWREMYTTGGPRVFQLTSSKMKSTITTVCWSMCREVQSEDVSRSVRHLVLWLSRGAPCFPSVTSRSRWLTWWQMPDIGSGGRWLDWARKRCQRIGLSLDSVFVSVSRLSVANPVALGPRLPSERMARALRSDLRREKWAGIFHVGLEIFP